MVISEPVLLKQSPFPLRSPSSRRSDTVGRPRDTRASLRHRSTITTYGRSGDGGSRHAPLKAAGSTRIGRGDGRSGIPTLDFSTLPAVEFRIILSPSDFDRSWSFYVDTIGLAVLRSWDEGGRGGIVIVDGGSQIELLERSGDGTTDHPSGVRIAWQVEDVDAEAARLDELGVEIVDPPADQSWGHRNTRLLDPDGVPITLYTVL